MLARYNLCCCRVSVCPSDGLSQVGVLLKQLNVGSCKSRGEGPFCGGNTSWNGVPNLFLSPWERRFHTFTASRLAA